MFIDQTIVTLAIPASRQGPFAVRDHAVDRQRLPALARRAVHARRQARRRARPGEWSRRRDRLRRLLGAVRRDADGRLGEAWIISFRVLQGAFAAMLFPAGAGDRRPRAFPLSERGRALAAFFGITGALTAVGPLGGGYLTEWTWRAIFWINILSRSIALILTPKAKPANERRTRRSTTAARCSSRPRWARWSSACSRPDVWGWTSDVDDRVDRRRRGAAGRVRRLRAAPGPTADAGADLRPARVRGRRVVLFLMSAVFVPFFFFASVYAQASLGDSATQAGVSLLVFFGGFAIAAQCRRADHRQARRAPGHPDRPLPRRPGSTSGGMKATTPHPRRPMASGSPSRVRAARPPRRRPIGVGPAPGTDALNRAPGAPATARSPASTQTVRNLGASLGLAAMGSLFVDVEAGHAAVAHSTEKVAWISGRDHGRRRASSPRLYSLAVASKRPSSLPPRTSVA